jgi:hypothetical protein
LSAKPISEQDSQPHPPGQDVIYQLGCAKAGTGIGHGGGRTAKLVGRQGGILVDGVCAYAW